MLRILSISCIVLCVIVIIYVITIYLELRRYQPPKKPKEKKPVSDYDYFATKSRRERKDYWKI